MEQLFFVQNFFICPFIDFIVKFCSQFKLCHKGKDATTVISKYCGLVIPNLPCQICQRTPLTHNNMATFGAFQAITGKEDFEECKQLLEQHRWDLQFAVQDALNIAEGRENVYQQEQDVSSDSDQE